MRYRVILEQNEEGFCVTVPGVPGCVSQGVTEEEALENIRDALTSYFEVVNELNANKIVREVEVAI